MILVDTNCLLLISDVDTNAKVDKQKLSDFISSREIAISSVSIFEILNSPINKNKYSFIINNAINKCLKLNFLNTTFFDSYFNCSILYNLEYKNIKEQEKAKNEMSKAIVDVFALYYSNLLACAISAYFIIFSNFEDELKDDDYFKKGIQNNFDLLEFKLRQFLLFQFKCMITNYTFNEKNRKSIIECLYFTLVKNYAVIYNKTLSDLYEKSNISYSKLFSRLLSKTKRINLFKTSEHHNSFSFAEISLLESLTKQLVDNDKEKMKQYLLKVAASLSRDDNRMSPYLNTLFESNLGSLLFEKARFNDNDIIDSLIIDFISFFQFSGKFEGFLTFDKKLINKSKKVYPKLKIYGNDFFR